MSFAVAFIEKRGSSESIWTLMIVAASLKESFNYFQIKEIWSKFDF